jgi:hypothetical protein
MHSLSHKCLTRMEVTESDQNTRELILTPAECATKLFTALAAPLLLTPHLFKNIRLE